MALPFATLFLLSLILALVFFALSRAQHRRTGLPIGARVVYSDTGAWQKVARPLVARRFALVGKPDYIVEDRQATIPIEVKPNRVASAPRESDVMQLAAYALLIEEALGVRPPYGLLKYRAALFQIDFTDELRAALIDLLRMMRRDLGARDIARSHSEPYRCRACGYRADCGQALEP